MAHPRLQRRGCHATPSSVLFGVDFDPNATRKGPLARPSRTPPPPSQLKCPQSIQVRKTVQVGAVAQIDPKATSPVS